MATNREWSWVGMCNIKPYVCVQQTLKADDDSDKLYTTESDS